jgi:poly-gamma-glutamate synthesis protein (capsule biosynthesis protein)
MKIAKIDLPQNAVALLNLKGVKRSVLTVVHKLADVFGFFDYPREIGINHPDPASLPSDPRFIAYWMYKTMHPIIRAKRGSGLETYFESRREKPSDMLPPGFDGKTEVSISLVGDLMRTGGAENSKDRIYEGVADHIFDVEIAYANLESTLTKGEVQEIEFKPGETPEINLTPEQYVALIQHKERYFDIVQISNNHILDCGDEGLGTTRECLLRDNVFSVGTNDSAEAAGKGVIIESKGLKIGWVAFTYSVNWRPIPEEKPYLVNIVPFHMKANPDLSPIENQLRWCREQGCDLVVLGLHWGLEFELFPHPDQLEWAHWLAEAGADVIVGHHPHVPQPVEFYRTRRDPDRVVPIFYSLGNLTPVLSNPATVLSLIANLKVISGRNDGAKRTYVADVGITPTAIVSTSEAGSYELRLYKVADLCGMELEDEMDRYVSEIASLVDILLGKTWRLE